MMGKRKVSSNYFWKLRLQECWCKFVLVMFCRDVSLWLGGVRHRGSSSKRSTPCAWKLRQGNFWSRYIWNLLWNFSFQFYSAVPNQFFVLYALFDFVYVSLFICDCFVLIASPRQVSHRRDTWRPGLSRRLTEYTPVAQFLIRGSSVPVAFFHASIVSLKIINRTYVAGIQSDERGYLQRGDDEVVCVLNGWLLFWSGLWLGGN